MKNYKHKSKQQGVALAIGIILLLIIAVIGVTSMKSALLQEKMSGGLSRNAYADTAAYTLLVGVENYLFRQYQNNNGVESVVCDYCGDEVRGSDWYDFISSKNMTGGSTYPGSLSLISSLKGNLHDDPRFVVYPIKDDSNGFYGASDGEEDNASAGGSSGSLGSNSSSLKLDFYKIASKANDSTGNIFVIYESIFAIKQN